MYALVALGYTLVYGIIELINFAHGDVFMWGTMISVTSAINLFGLDGSQNGFVTLGALILVLLAAMVFCATLNVTIERVAYRRLRNAPRLAPLITAIGMSFILQNLGAVFFGFDYRQADAILPLAALFHIGSSAYRENALIVLLVDDSRAARDDLPGAQHPGRQGDARHRAGSRRRAHARHRRRPHDRVHLRARRRARRRRRLPVRHVLHARRASTSASRSAFSHSPPRCSAASATSRAPRSAGS